MLPVFPGQALFRRELVQTLRSRRYYWIMAFALFCFIAGVLALWPDPDRQHNPQVLASFSNNVVRGLMTLTSFMICLLVPAIAGASIALERENETYDQLHMTLVRPLWMVFGKLSTSLGFIVLSVFSLLPVAASVFYLIGVSLGDFVLDFLLIAAVALACGCGAVCCSAFFRRSVIAIAVSYVLMLLVAGAIPPLVMMVAALFSGEMRIYGLDATEWGRPLYDGLVTIRTASESIAKLTPGYLLFAESIQSANNFGMAAPKPGGISYALSGAFLLSFSYCTFWLAVWRTRQAPPSPVVNREKPLDDSALLEVRRKKFPYYLIDPMKRKPMIPEGRNPMMVKELRWGLLGEMTRLVRIFYVSFIIGTFVLCGLYSLGDIRDMAASARFALTVLMGLNLLLLPALLANMLTKEREQGNLDMLRMTLITPRDIILGKITAGFLTITPFYLATVLSTGFLFFISAFVWRETGIVWAIAQGLITLFVIMLFVVSLTVFISACTRNTQTAIVHSYILGIIALFGGMAVVFAVLQGYPQIQAYVLGLRRPVEVPNEVFYHWLNIGSMLSPLVAYIGPMDFVWERNTPSLLPYWIRGMALFSFGACAVTAATVFAFRRSKVWSE